MLHSFFDEYISSNIGNNSYTSIKHFHDECQKINNLSLVDITYTEHKESFGVYAGLLKQIFNNSVNVAKKQEETIKILNEIFKYTEEQIKKPNSKEKEILENVSTNYMNFSRDGLIQLCRDKFIRQVSDNIFLDVGYYNYSSKSGHFIGGYFYGKFFTLINSGDGLQHHEKKGNLFNCIQKYEITYAQKINLLTNILTTQSMKYNGGTELLYNTIKEMKLVNVHENNDLYYVRQQYSGSCTFFGIYYFIYYYLVREVNSTIFFDVFQYIFKKKLLNDINIYFAELKHVTNKDLNFYTALMKKSKIIDKETNLENIKTKLTISERAYKILNNFNTIKEDSSRLTTLYELLNRDIQNCTRLKLYILEEKRKYVNNISKDTKEEKKIVKINYLRDDLVGILEKIDTKVLYELRDSYTIHIITQTIVNIDIILKKEVKIDKLVDIIYTLFSNESIAKYAKILLLYLLLFVNRKLNNVMKLEERDNFVNAYTYLNLSSDMYEGVNKYSPDMALHFNDYMKYNICSKYYLKDLNINDISTLLSKYSHYTNMENKHYLHWIKTINPEGKIDGSVQKMSSLQDFYFGYEGKDRVFSTNDEFLHFLFQLENNKYWYKLYSIINLSTVPSFNIEEIINFKVIPFDIPFDEKMIAQRVQKHTNTEISYGIFVHGAVERMYVYSSTEQKICLYSYKNNSSQIDIKKGINKIILDSTRTYIYVDDDVFLLNPYSVSDESQNDMLENRIIYDAIPPVIEYKDIPYANTITYFSLFETRSIIDINETFNLQLLNHEFIRLHEPLTNTRFDNPNTHLTINNTDKPQITNLFINYKYNETVVGVIQKFNFDKFIKNIDVLNIYCVIYVLTVCLYYQIDISAYITQLNKYCKKITSNIEFDESYMKTIKNNLTNNYQLIIIKIINILINTDLITNYRILLSYLRESFSLETEVLEQLRRRNNSLGSIGGMSTVQVLQYNDEKLISFVRNSNMINSLHVTLKKIIAREIVDNDLVDFFNNNNVNTGLEIFAKKIYFHFEEFKITNIIKTSKYIRYTIISKNITSNVYDISNYTLPDVIQQNYLFIEEQKDVFTGISLHKNLPKNIKVDVKNSIITTDNLQFVEVSENAIISKIGFDKYFMLCDGKTGDYKIIFYELHEYIPKSDKPDYTKPLTFEYKNKILYCNNFEVITYPDTKLFNSWVYEIDNCFLLKKNDFEYKILYVNEFTMKEVKQLVTSCWNKLNIEKFSSVQQNEVYSSLKCSDVANTFSIIDIHYTGLFVKFDNVKQCNTFFLKTITKQKSIHTILLFNQFIHYNYNSAIGKQLINFLLKHNMINSPFKYYFISKLQKLYELEIKPTIVTEHTMRDEYYPNFYKYISIEEDDTKEYFNYDFEKIKKCTDRNTEGRIATDEKSETIINRISLLYDAKEVSKARKTIYNMICFEKCEIKYLVKKYYRSFYNLLENKTIFEILNKLKFYCSTDRNTECKMELVNDVLKDVNTELLFLDNKRKAEYVFFEILFGFIIKKAQQEIHNKITSENKKLSIYQLLMGKGKSSVIMPLLSLFSTTANTLIVVPNHLINQTYTNLLKNYSAIMNFNNLSLFNIKRVMNMELSQYAKYFRFDTNEIMSVPVITIMNDVSLKSIKLNLIENMFSKENKMKGGGVYIPIENVNDKKYTSQHKKRMIVGEYEKNLLNAIKHQSFVIIDEIDSVLNPFSSDLNYPIGTQRDIQYYALITHIILHILHTIFNNDTLKQKVKIIIDDEMAKQVINPIFLQMKDDIKDANYHLFCDIFIEGKEYKTSSDINFTFVEAFYKLYNMFLIALVLKYNKDYGFGIYDFKNYGEKNYYTAIPYSAVNSPVNGSEYNDIILNIILTGMSYYYESLRDRDIFQLINIFRRSYNLLKNMEIVNAKYYKVNKYLKEEKVDLEKIIISGILPIISNIHLKYELDMIYFREFVYPTFMKVNESYFNISFTDIISNHMTFSKTGFSGTINIEVPVIINDDYNFTELAKDDKTLKSIEKAINDSKVHIVKNTDSIIQFFVDNKYNVLIDAGAYFKEYSNYDMVLKLITYDFYKDKKIIYLDTNDNIVFYYQNVIHDFKDEIFSYEEICIYYDHKHIIGTDIKQPLQLKGLTTINYFNRYTDTSQAIFRMRNLENSHTNDFILVNSFNYDEKNTMLTHLNNKENKYFSEYKQKFYIQKIKTLIRNNDDSYKNYIEHHDIKFEAKSLENITHDAHRKNMVKKICGVDIGKYLDEIKKLCNTQEMKNIFLTKTNTIDVSQQVQLEQNTEMTQNVQLNVEQNIQQSLIMDYKRSYTYHFNTTLQDYLNFENFVIEDYIIDLRNLADTYNIYLSPVVIDMFVKQNIKHTYFAKMENRVLIISSVELLPLMKFFEYNKVVATIHLPNDVKFEKLNYNLMLLSILCGRKLNISEQIIFSKESRKYSNTINVINEFEKLYCYTLIHHELFDIFQKDVTKSQINNDMLKTIFNIEINANNREILRNYLISVL